MIIVAQDKSIIVNFDNIENIRIYAYENAVAIQAIGTSCNSNEFYMLGLYKTEERAKAVLKEIVNKYGKYDIDDCNAVTVFPKVYEMPED